jgi:hypothetical protein
MTNAPVRPVPAPNSRLPAPAVASRRRMAAGNIPTAQRTARVAPLLESYFEPLHRLEAMMRQLAETTQPAGIHAFGDPPRGLPQLADTMDHEALPLLNHLDQLGPTSTSCSTGSRSSATSPAGCPRHFGGATTTFLTESVSTESTVVTGKFS